MDDSENILIAFSVLNSYQFQWFIHHGQLLDPGRLLILILFSTLDAY